jgi:CheY-like chemotaxis protein
VTILLIEDEKPVAECLQERLEAIGAKVDVAKTWAEAAARIRVHPYDIVSLDIILPDSGLADAPRRIEFIRSVIPETKVVVVSGIEIDALERISKEAGVPVVIKGDAIVGHALDVEILNQIRNRKGFEENVALLEKACRSMA